MSSNTKFVIFPITFKCNLTCKYCAFKDTTDVNLERVFPLLTNSPFEWVFITGGEPLLVPQVVDLCRSLKKIGKKVGLTTNGTINNTSIFEFVDRLGVSIDGTKFWHDSYRGSGNFDKSISYIRQAISNKVTTVVMSTIFTESYGYVSKLSQVIDDVKPNYWQITRDINNPNISINSSDFKSSIPTVFIDHFLDSGFALVGPRLISTKCNFKELLSGTIHPPSADPVNPHFKNIGWVRSNFLSYAQTEENDPKGVLKAYLDIVDAVCITGARY